MRVFIAGANGQVAGHLVPLLVEAGHEVVGGVRNPKHVETLDAAGAGGVVVDLEGDPGAIHAALEGCDAVVFAAGAGPGSGAARKITVDLEGAVKLIEAAEQHGLRRFVMISAMAADDPDEGPDALQPYLVAKGGADARLRRATVPWTIVRPGRLTGDPPSGSVEVAAALGRRGDVPRADVAAVIAAVLERPALIGHTFEVLAGDTPIAEALDTLG